MYINVVKYRLHWFKNKKQHNHQNWSSRSFTPHSRQPCHSLITGDDLSSQLVPVAQILVVGYHEVPNLSVSCETSHLKSSVKCARDFAELKTREVEVTYTWVLLLPKPPYPIDLGMVKEEHRIVRTGGRASHFATNACMDSTVLSYICQDVDNKINRKI